MVEHRRKEVPVQKASIAVPLSFWAMIYILCSDHAPTHWHSELTGNATDNEVPSSATIKVMTARVRKATYSLIEGLKSAGKSCLVSGAMDGGVSEPF